MSGAPTPRRLVIDASVLTSVVLRDDPTGIANRVFRHVPSSLVFVPALAWYETRSAVRSAEIAERIDYDDVISCMMFLSELRLTYDEQREDLVMFLAQKHQLKFKDACYIELALRLDVELSTLDNSMRRAAVEAGVTMFDGDDDA